MFVYANYIGLRQFYRYVVNIGRWSPYEGGQLDRFHCINILFLQREPIQTAVIIIIIINIIIIISISISIISIQP